MNNRRIILPMYRGKPRPDWMVPKSDCCVCTGMWVKGVQYCTPITQKEAFSWSPSCRYYGSFIIFTTLELDGRLVFFSASSRLKSLVFCHYFERKNNYFSMQKLAYYGQGLIYGLGLFYIFNGLQTRQTKNSIYGQDCIGLWTLKYIPSGTSQMKFVNSCSMGLYNFLGSLWEILNSVFFILYHFKPLW